MKVISQKTIKALNYPVIDLIMKESAGKKTYMLSSEESDGVVDKELYDVKVEISPKRAIEFAVNNGVSFNYGAPIKGKELLKDKRLLEMFDQKEIAEAKFDISFFGVVSAAFRDVFGRKKVAENVAVPEIGKDIAKPKKVDNGPQPVRLFKFEGLEAHPKVEHIAEGVFNFLDLKRSYSQEKAFRSNLVKILTTFYDPNLRKSDSLNVNCGGSTINFKYHPETIIIRGMDDRMKIHYHFEHTEMREFVVQANIDRANRNIEVLSKANKIHDKVIEKHRDNGMSI